MNCGKFLLCLMVATTLPLCAEETAKPAPAKPPRQPWHLADIWWNFQAPIPHFESLDIDVTIDRDVPPDVNLYIAPCGLGEIGGINFYGGLQSNANGWPSKENHVRAFMGKGAIFSRWGKGKLSVSQARGAADSYYEAADYEGDFVSVRRPFAWAKGTYTWSLRACDTETDGSNTYTWVSCFVTAHDTGASRYIGSLRFEGTDLTFWARHAAFVEVYATAKIAPSPVPEVKVTFGYPRINGVKPPFKSASVNHPAPGEMSGGPNHARTEAIGDQVVVTVGPEFERAVKDRHYRLDLKTP